VYALTLPLRHKHRVQRVVPFFFCRSPPRTLPFFRVGNTEAYSAPLTRVLPPPYFPLLKGWRAILSASPLLNFPPLRVSSTISRLNSAFGDCLTLITILAFTKMGSPLSPPGLRIARLRSVVLSLRRVYLFTTPPPASFFPPPPFSLSLENGGGSISCLRNRRSGF